MEQLTIDKKKNSKCQFCGSVKNNYLSYGPKYKLGNVTTHYYCLLLSNRLIQNGNDDEGILGFLLSDIEKELKRASNILCIYCKRGNATITCASSKCNKSFHLPCGLKKGSSHQFVDRFKSFCAHHRLVQNIPEKILRDAYKTKVVCCICQEKVNVRRKDVLWAPCCRKTWYHRDCVQKLAHSAGYFCKCPACNDVKKFNEWMQRFGIFIPQQDASWELVPNAFEDLLFRYGTCDAEDCKCPGGRQKNTENTMWEIILCESCGSQGIHVACGNLKFVDPEWECPACRKITKNVKSVTEVSNSSKEDEGSSKQLKLSDVGHKKRRRNSEELENSVLDKRKKFRVNTEEDEVEIDVETVDEAVKDGNDDNTVAAVADKSRDLEKIRFAQAAEIKVDQKTDPQEVLTLVKPGPLSYKLSLLRKIWGGLLTSPENRSADSSTSAADLIDLVDSDKEDSDVEVIAEVSGKFPGHRPRVNRRNSTGNETVRCGLASEVSKPRKFSLDDFEVVAVVSVQPAGRTEEIRENTAGVEDTRNCITLSKQSEIFPLYPNRVGMREGKDLGKTIDDDVIILTD